MTEKVCSKCGRLLPIEQFRKCGNGYRRTECAQCSKFIELTRMPKLPKRRTCKTCGKELAITNFPKINASYRRRECRPCYNKRHLENARANGRDSAYWHKRNQLRKAESLTRAYKAVRS